MARLGIQPQAGQTLGLLSAQSLLLGKVDCLIKQHLLTAVSTLYPSHIAYLAISFHMVLL